MESEQKRKPVLALAGRFVRWGGCGCETCTGTDGQEEMALGLRKIEIPDLLQDALARITRAGWKEAILPPSTDGSVFRVACEGDA